VGGAALPGLGEAAGIHDGVDRPGPLDKLEGIPGLAGSYADVGALVYLSEQLLSVSRPCACAPAGVPWARPNCLCSLCPRASP
jgi:hypothetical protein